MNSPARVIGVVPFTKKSPPQSHQKLAENRQDELSEGDKRTGSHRNLFPVPEEIQEHLRQPCTFNRILPEGSSQPQRHTHFLPNIFFKMITICNISLPSHPAGDTDSKKFPIMQEKLMMLKTTWHSLKPA